ncbi:MAG: VOC family protein [Flavisolibacter sp.]|nr:VOC family protein [Flavisolibacter sp.]MBD0294398.1 VOC family protein [Flavisolibacter sp.]MBD0366719.1 VOC family protein [Flavisolibacter sp.]MBD0378000.1 VOC family protein [Flavisolibacter sp.]
MDTLEKMTKPKKFLKPLPHLPVNNLQLTLDYYRDKLGFTDEWTFGEIDGGIRRDDLRLLFAEDKEFTKDINNKQHRLPLLWFVDDIEAIYAEFKNRGIEIADDLRTHSYGLREFAFIDINGYYIRIAEGQEEE